MRKIDKKARYFARVHLYIVKYYYNHVALTIQCASVRMVVIIFISKGFRAWVADVKLAYLQSEKLLIRKISLTSPAPEFELSPDECLELLKPLYGLADSVDK